MYTDTSNLAQHIIIYIQSLAYNVYSSMCTCNTRLVRETLPNITRLPECKLLYAGSFSPLLFKQVIFIPNRLRFCACSKSSKGVSVQIVRRPWCFQTSSITRIHQLEWIEICQGGQQRLNWRVLSLVFFLEMKS